jgi:phospholipid transport system substrate-binding protein
MPTRRATLTLVSALAFLAAPPWPVRRAWAQPGERAIAFIKSTTDKLVAIVNSESSPAEKRHRLREILDAVVDHDDIARYCLGRFWRIATPEQQKEYMVLFYDLLAAQIASHLGEYKGVRVTLGLARKFEDTEIVITTVERPSNPATRVDWVVSTTTGAPQIVDLIAEGTSMRITQASDFTAYLAHHQYNVGDLIAAMHQKSAQNG